jgi:hypothetical protein
MRFSGQRVWWILSSLMWCHIVWYTRTCINVSEEHAGSIFGVKETMTGEASYSDMLVHTHQTTRRHIPHDSNLEVTNDIELIWCDISHNNHMDIQKALLIRLELTRIKIWKIKKCCSQLSMRTYFKRHAAFRKADVSFVCLYKTWQLLQTCVITHKNKYILDLQSMNKYIVFISFNNGSIVIFIFISTAYIIKFSIYLYSKFFVFVFSGYLLLH